MDEMERVQHELHSRTSRFDVVLGRAQATIAEAMWTGARFYLAFSGGADSTVLLHLLADDELLDRIDVRFSDDGFDFPESLRFLSDCEQRYGFRLHRTRNLHSWRLWCEEMGRPDLCDDPVALEAWGNPHEWDDVRTKATHQEWREYGGVFLGLLASESKTRFYALKGGSKPLYRVKSEGGMWHCSPLASWTKRDVWAYLTSQNVPYNPVYDRLAELGVPLDRRRVAPATCFRVMQYGSHQALKQGWPDLYNRLTALFPMVRAF